MHRSLIEALIWSGISRSVHPGRYVEVLIWLGIGAWSAAVIRKYVHVVLLLAKIDLIVDRIDSANSRPVLRFLSRPVHGL